MGFFSRKKKVEAVAGTEQTSTTDEVKHQKEKKVKVTQQKATIDFIQASKAFEVSRIEQVEKSRTTAWKVAIGACVLATASVGAIAMMLPLKEVKPYVIRVDNNTGATDIVTMLQQGQTDYPEEIGKYFSALYVKTLEGYDWYTIKNQVDSVMMMSDSNMQNRVKNIFALESAPHIVYAERFRVEIKVHSVSFIGDNLVQVRFTKTVVPTNGGRLNAEKDYIEGLVTTKHIATIGYDYVNVPAVDEVRRVNPLGFTVKSYRVDDDGEQQ